MDQKFSEIESSPENEIFKIVFFPDRIYHAAYLNATVSKRYNYYVSEVRNKHDITLIKAKVFQDGHFLANVFRIEYKAGRLNETTREAGRMLNEQVICNLAFTDHQGLLQNYTFPLYYDSWIRAYQCEIWDNLSPVRGTGHHFKVLSQMGKNGAITRFPDMDDALGHLKDIQKFDVFFGESAIDRPTGYSIGSPTFDTDYMRTYQEPKTQSPSAEENTVHVRNYQLNFQRGWFLDSKDVVPVRYNNAMMESHNEAHRDDGTNIVEMKWILQREMGSDLVYFHEVNVTPNSFEGIHQHVGSEELYYIVSGTGIAYMGEEDDPAISDIYPTVEKEIFCIGKKNVKEIPVSAGKVIYTKSGGIHGIQNTSLDVPLIFVAFGYHCS